MRTCKWCGELKPLDAFAIAIKRTVYRRHECKACRDAIARTKWAAVPRFALARPKTKYGY